MAIQFTKASAELQHDFDEIVKMEDFVNNIMAGHDSIINNSENPFKKEV